MILETRTEVKKAITGGQFTIRDLLVARSTTRPKVQFVHGTRAKSMLGVVSLLEKYFLGVRDLSPSLRSTSIITYCTDTVVLYFKVTSTCNPKNRSTDQGRNKAYVTYYQPTTEWKEQGRKEGRKEGQRQTGMHALQSCGEVREPKEMATHQRAQS